MKTLLLFIFMTALYCTANAQNPDWLHFNNDYYPELDDNIYVIKSDSSNQLWFGSFDGALNYDYKFWTVYHEDNVPLGTVFSILVDSVNNIWFGTFGKGLIKFDGLLWTSYNTHNSGLHNNYVTDIEFDKFGNIWIATQMYGISVFDGTDWSIINESNSGLHSDLIKDIFIEKADQMDKIWIGTKWDGLILFYYNLWTVFDTSNSGIHSNEIRKIFKDSNNDLWIMHTHSFSIFNEYDWEVINYENSDLPNDLIWDIVEDRKGVIWIATNGGLVKYSNEEMRVFNTSNSGIPSDKLTSLKIDQLGNIWIGSTDGIIVYREGGVILDAKGEGIETVEEFLFYPNPFSESSVISFRLSEPGNVRIRVYNSIGNIISTLVDELLTAGEHRAIFNAAGLPQGMYYYTINIEGHIQSGKMILLK